MSEIDAKMASFIEATHAQERYLNDPQYHAELVRATDLLKMMDRAMKLELIDEDTRRRVIDSLITGAIEAERQQATARKLMGESER